MTTSNDKDQVSPNLNNEEEPKQPQVPQIDSARQLREQANIRLGEAKSKLLEAQKELEMNQGDSLKPTTPLIRKGATLRRMAQELRDGKAPMLRNTKKTPSETS